MNKINVYLLTIINEGMRSEEYFQTLAEAAEARRVAVNVAMRTDGWQMIESHIDVVERSVPATLS